MAELQASQAHFVRCVKPNQKLLPQELHGEGVVNQLKMSGMLDAVKLIQSGYPTRIPYADIHSKYKMHMPERVQSLSPAQFCEVIAEVCDVGKKDYALGLERMFFRLGCAAFLEELSEADPVMLTSIVLRFIVFVRYCSLLHCMCALLFFAALYLCDTVLCFIVFVRYCSLLHCMCAVLFLASLYLRGACSCFMVFVRYCSLLHCICAVLFGAF